MDIQLKVRGTKQETVEIVLNKEEQAKVAKKWINRNCGFDDLFGMLYLNTVTKCVENIEPNGHELSYRKSSGWNGFGFWVEHYHGSDSWRQIRAATPTESEFFEQLNQLHQTYLKLKLEGSE